MAQGKSFGTIYNNRRRICGSDYLLMYRTEGFNRYTEKGERVEAMDFFQDLEAGCWTLLCITA
jgi:hypothetical protein